MLEVAALSALVSVAVCMLNVWLVWWLGRIWRTAEAVTKLMGQPAVRQVWLEKPDHAAKLGDSTYWSEYRETTLRPALVDIELFATPTMRGFPCIYSVRVVRKMARDAIVSIWAARETQHYIEDVRGRTANSRTIYGDFERLAKWLRRHPL